MKNSGVVKQRLIVLSSTFPRWEGDKEPRFVFDLCRRLADEYEITVIAPHAAGTRCRETMTGLDVIRFRYGPLCWERLAYDGGIVANLRRRPWLYLVLPLFFLGQAWSLLRTMRDVRPAAVHAHWIVPQGTVLAMVLLLSGSRPHTVCTVHGSDVSALRGRFWSWLRRAVSRRCGRIVAVSDALETALLEDGCPPERLSVIPMGVDLRGLFSPDGQWRSETEVLYAGRLVSGKGVDVLLRAFPRILQNCPEATLTVAGDGPERGSLEAAARSLGLGMRVSFTGAVAHADLAVLYRRAALLVLPSRDEGFGLVVVEAMGSGCPVVASDLPAIRALVQDGETGRLFRTGDPDRLAQAVSELLADEKVRRGLAERARHHVLERYDWQSIACGYAALLRAMAEETA